MAKKKGSDLLTILNDFISNPTYQPQTKSQLFKTLKLKTTQTSSAEQALTSLKKDQKIFFKKTLIYKTKESGESLVRGTLRVNIRGFGFVIPEEGSGFEEDIFIPKDEMNSAIDGDLVEASSFTSRKKNKGPEGKIVQIIKRGKSHLAGIVQDVGHNGRLYIYAPLLGPKKIIEAESSETRTRGDRILVKVLDFGNAYKPIEGEEDSYLGHIDDPSVDVNAAIKEFAISSLFSEEAISEAKLFGTKITAKQMQNRLDLTETTTLTIDPTTAKDFDDAISISKDVNGEFKLGVHIADVAYYVKPGSFLDEEAFKRCNSTYLPGTCVPMLPEELSNHLCSLKPKVIRLCVSVLMTISKQGDLLDYEIARTAIKSSKRFTYEEAKQVLDKKKSSKYLSELELMVELCALLKKKRYDRGSIDFAMSDVVLNIDDQGMPFSYEVIEYDITHQMIEEFMLKANEVTATHLASKGKPLIFRVHESPHEENLEDFFRLARSFGFSVPPKPSTEQLQELFSEIKISPFAPQLNVAFIRSMKLANYSPDNIGHFGLSLEQYCHFTSPIRRYSDLVIQRLLFNELPAGTDLHQISLACSEKERISFKAEQSVKTLKKLRLLQKWHQEDPDKIYTCPVTKVKSFGLYFEVPPLGIEGFLHISEISSDYLEYHETINAFIGVSTGVRFTLGDSISVRIQSINLSLLEATFSPYIQKKTKKKRL